MTEPTCTVRVTDGWDNHPCGRKVKENGKCGLHVAVDKRREQGRVQRLENRDLAGARKAATQPLKDALAKVGIPAYFAGEESYGSYPGGHQVRIDAAHFDRLLTVLNAYTQSE